MKPLAVLLLTFGLALAATWLWRGQPGWLLAGNVALAVMLVFTGVAHFPYVAGMVQMLPAWLPGRRAWVLGTGVLEVALGLGLLAPATRGLAAGATIIFLVLIFPANVLSAFRHLNYQTGTLDGPGPRYLWAALPLVSGAAASASAIYRLGLVLRAAPGGVAGATL